jgi:hypothetical protein
MSDPLQKLRHNARKIHETLARDIALGDPKAATMAGALGGEMRAARQSLGISYPLPLPERKEKEVRFKNPKAVISAACREGRVVDAVTVGPVMDVEWGWYYYFSELIEWHSDKSKSVRISYYYAKFDAKSWRMGGQYSIEDSPSVIKALLEKTLGKKEWFE